MEPSSLQDFIKSEFDYLEQDVAISELPVTGVTTVIKEDCMPMGKQIFQYQTESVIKIEKAEHDEYEQISTDHDYCRIENEELLIKEEHLESNKSSRGKQIFQYQTESVIKIEKAEHDEYEQIYTDHDYCRIENEELLIKEENLESNKSSRYGRVRALKEEAIPSSHLPVRRIDKQTSGRDFHQDRRRKKQIIGGFLKGTDICDTNSDEGSGERLSGLSSDAAVEYNDNVKIISTCSQSIGVNTDSIVDDRDEIIANLRKKIKFLEKRQDVVGKLFSNEQMKKLVGSKCYLRWSVEDISKAVDIYSAGPKSYQMLLKMGYPFPAVTTLRSLLKKN